MLLNFNELNDASFIIKKISAVNILSKNKVLSHGKSGRILNGFLYMISGSCMFEYGGNSFEMHAGAFAYLPKGSKHKYSILSEPVRYIRIDFNMYDWATNDEIVFSTEPYLLFENTPHKCETIIHKLSETFISGKQDCNLKMNALLYDLLAKIASYHTDEFSENQHYNTISPCIKYIENNLKNDIPTHILAEMCNLSPSHFRRIFKAATGTTPTEYRTRLRIEKACILLENNLCNISEISEQLGFENIFYFSRVFKKIMGIPPSKYKKYS